MTAAETPRIQFATTSDGVRIAYTVAGDGEPLVCTPDWVGHQELEWQGDAGEFHGRLASARRLILFDGRGTGLSDRRVDDLSLQARLRDLEAVVEHLRLERFSIFAWSHGTVTAIVYAAEHPEQVTQLVLYAPFCEGYGKGRKAVGRAVLDLIRADWGVAGKTVTGFTNPDASREEEQQALSRMREASSGEVAARLLEEAMFHTDVCHHLPQIAAPSLVLHRRDDNTVPLEFGRRVASLLPNARFLPLEGNAHLPDRGDTEPVLRAVQEFLGVEVAPPAPALAEPVPAGAPVTLLFTDMEGSTALTQRLGDAQAQELLQAHNTIVREALQAHGGSEIKHTGDGIMASFPSASRGLECAVQIQRGFAQRNEEHRDAPINVRIGLNAGEPVRERDDLFGTAVQLARRICDQAEPGQILASNVVRELVAGKGFLFADRGETALRGFEDPMRLYEVRWGE